MRSNALFLIALAVGTAAPLQWQIAQAPFRFEFPRDHFNHPEYQTEWWYYTGNLRAQDGKHFGFELTFFRSAMRINDAGVSVWNPDQIYLAHFAVSDLDRREYYYRERINRAGPGIAGVSLAQALCWNGNWHARWLNLATGQQQLQAVTDTVDLALIVTPEKPLVINGQGGVSVKGPERGESSHYLSFTRLRANGALRWQGRKLQVEGLAWMDHEFFTPARHSDITGWDWFSIQLGNNEELMLYRLRHARPQSADFSSGTYVDAHGAAHFLPASDFELHATGNAGSYPADWLITVPRLHLNLREHTSLPNQELAGNGNTPGYWEGAVTYAGTEGQSPVKGVGYLEMTGYGGRQVWLSAK